MSEQEFDLYLKLLSRCLHLTAAQREQIADELRDHLQERLEELAAAGVPREKAVVQALDEFGDAAVLAADFSAVARLKRRRFLMRLSLGSVAALAAAMWVTFAFWPENHAVQGPPLVVAQEKAKPPATGTKSPLPKPGAQQKVLAVSGPPLSSDMGGGSKSEQRINEALEQAVDFVIEPEPLKEAIDFIATRYQIPIVLDQKTLDDASVDTTQEVKMAVQGIKLRNLLKLVLEPLNVTYVVDDEVLKITTVDKAKEMITVVVYDCRDLVNVRSIEIPDSQQRRIEQMARVLEEQRRAREATQQQPNPSPQKPSAKNAKPEDKGTKRRGLMVAIPLIRVLQGAAGTADDWDDEENSERPSISEFGGLLIVRQSQRVHEQIKHILADIRRMKKEGAFANFDKDHASSSRPNSPLTSATVPQEESFVPRPSTLGGGP